MERALQPRSTRVVQKRGDVLGQSLSVLAGVLREQNVTLRTVRIGLDLSRVRLQTYDERTQVQELLNRNDGVSGFRHLCSLLP